MILSERSKAKYKIEIHFGKSRTTKGPNVGALTVFESGNRLNGEGDEMMYICSQRDSGLALNAPGYKDKPIQRGTGGCGAYIPGSAIRGGIANCPNCGSLINAEQLTSTQLFNLTTDSLAEKLCRWFEQLESNCDIYLKYHPTDIRYKAMESTEGLDKARMLRGLTIYPLANIIKDTSNGASLKKRFVALLSN